MRVPYTSSPSQTNIFLQNLSECLDSGNYCDLTFIVGCQTFPCHRVVVASSSAYFQALLSHAFKETNLSSIELHELEPISFSQLLRYMYSGTIEIDDENIENLLVASDMLQLVEVVRFCCHFLSISLNEKNVLDIWKLADELDCHSLRNDAEQYMLTHFRDLIKRDTITKLPQHLLITLISHDDLIVDDERQVFEAILTWSMNESEKCLCQMNIFNHLLDNVRFEYISNEHQKMTLHQTGLDPFIVGRIESMIAHRRFSTNNNPARRGMRQTCYIFGGYGSSTVSDDGTPLLFTSSFRCRFNIVDSSLLSIDLDQIPGDGMRYPRMHHQAAALGSLVYVVGGEDGDNIFNSVEIFDPLTKTNRQWTQTGSMLTPRCNFGLVSIGSTTLYALGGHIGADITSSIETFNCQTGIWTLSPYSLKAPCYAFACVLLNGLIVCIGGSCIFNLPVKTTEIFNPKTGQSYLCTDMNEARSFCSACVDDDQEKIYVFGGADANGHGLHSVEVYNSYHCRWSLLPSMFYARISPCVCRIGNLIIVFGGRTNLAAQNNSSEILKTAEIFDIQRNIWLRTNDLPVHVFGAATVLR